MSKADFHTGVTAIVLVTVFVCTGVAQTVTTFDVPNSTSVFTSAINQAGEIVGFYYDTSYVSHGFLRNLDGTIVSFDAPGTGVQGTVATAINPAGQIAGVYTDTNFVHHGFLRNPKGTITSFDAPGAASQGTFAISINPAGQIAGYYDKGASDSAQTSVALSLPVFLFPVGGMHGFLRQVDGTVITFDVDYMWDVTGINPAGMITGTYLSPIDLLMHGFLRNSTGTITSFDAPGAITGLGSVCPGHPCFGTMTAAINPAGEITGFSSGAEFGEVHGFLRGINSRFTLFDVNGAMATYPSAMNQEGEIAGVYIDTNQGEHGFIRQTNGRINVFDVPGSIDTVVTGINAKGQVVGYYQGATYAYHAFVRSR